MSIFSTIAHAEHTFVAWVEKEFAKFEKAAPTLEQLADSGFKYATVTLTILKTQVTGEAATVIDEALKDITVLSAVVYDAGAHPTIGTMVQDIVQNLQGLLTAGHITGNSTVSTITKVVSTLAALASAFLQVAPVVAAAA